jgi:transposase-like protein
VAVAIDGKQFRLWRVVDDEGKVLDLLVQRQRDKAAAVAPSRSLGIRAAERGQFVKT